MKVSIVIPTYCRPGLLARLLASIEKQTFRDFEVIIVDDGSPSQDEYKKIVEEYKAKFNELFFLSNRNNKGAPYSRNRGIKLAKYSLIALVDDDDEWLPQKLEKQIKLFQDNDPSLELVYTWADTINANGNVSYRYRSKIEGNPIKEILNECFIPSSSVMVRKKSILDAGLFDESLPSCQDWDMWTRMILKGSQIMVVRGVYMLRHVQYAGIGNSISAKKGYFRYYKKHLLVSLRHGCYKNLFRIISAIVS